MNEHRQNPKQVVCKIYRCPVFKCDHNSFVFKLYHCVMTLTAQL